MGIKLLLALYRCKIWPQINFYMINFSSHEITVWMISCACCRVLLSRNSPYECTWVWLWKTGYGILPEKTWLTRLHYVRSGLIVFTEVFWILQVNVDDLGLNWVWLYCVTLWPWSDRWVSNQHDKGKQWGRRLLCVKAEPWHFFSFCFYWLTLKCLPR